MKSKQEKRAEAIERIKSYTYGNSKAKRRGVSEEQWEAERQATLAKLEGRND